MCKKKRILLFFNGSNTKLPSNYVSVLTNLVNNKIRSPNLSWLPDKA